ncbi:hypothetical protein REPUB_Repub04eG0189800 [Reevesia pubescens]
MDLPNFKRFHGELPSVVRPKRLVDLGSCEDGTLKISVKICIYDEKLKSTFPAVDSSLKETKVHEKYLDKGNDFLWICDPDLIFSRSRFATRI